MHNLTNNQQLDPFVYRVPDTNEKINQHPWKLSRERCILNLLKKRRLHNIADIGVNDMFYTKKLRSFVDGKVYAVDIIFPENGIIKDNIICVNDIEKLPENQIDCMILMDVLEHIEDDKAFFNKILDKINVNGTILITVPAWQFLFSAHDVRAQHFRRYNRKQLFELMKQDCIKIERCHYFYTSLFLTRLLCLLKKEKFNGNDSNWKYSEKDIITIFVKKVLNIDFMINKILDKIAIHLPGLSLYAICKKIK
jgi:hypothetical protein